MVLFDFEHNNCGCKKEQTTWKHRHLLLRPHLREVSGLPGRDKLEGTPGGARLACAPKNVVSLAHLKSAMFQVRKWTPFRCASDRKCWLGFRCASDRFLGAQVTLHPPWSLQPFWSCIHLLCSWATHSMRVDEVLILLCLSFHQKSSFICMILHEIGQQVPLWFLKNWFWWFCEGIFYLEPAFSTAIYLWNDGLPWCHDALFQHVQGLYLEWRYSHTHTYIYIFIKIYIVLCNEAYVMESRPSKTALTGTVPPGRWSVIPESFGKPRKQSHEKPTTPRSKRQSTQTLDTVDRLKSCTGWQAVYSMEFQGLYTGLHPRLCRISFINSLLHFVEIMIFRSVFHDAWNSRNNK